MLALLEKRDNHCNHSRENQTSIESIHSLDKTGKQQLWNKMSFLLKPYCAKHLSADWGLNWGTSVGWQAEISVTVRTQFPVSPSPGSQGSHHVSTTMHRGEGKSMGLKSLEISQGHFQGGTFRASNGHQSNCHQTHHTSSNRWAHKFPVVVLVWLIHRSIRLNWLKLIEVVYLVHLWTATRHIVHHMATKLSTSWTQFQVGTKQVGLPWNVFSHLFRLACHKFTGDSLEKHPLWDAANQLNQRFNACFGFVVKPWPVVTSLQCCKPKRYKCLV